MQVTEIMEQFVTCSKILCSDILWRRPRPIWPKRRFTLVVKMSNMLGYLAHKMKPSRVLVTFFSVCLLIAIGLWWRTRVRPRGKVKDTSTVKVLAYGFWRGRTGVSFLKSGVLNDCEYSCTLEVDISHLHDSDVLFLNMWKGIVPPGLCSEETSGKLKVLGFYEAVSRMQGPRTDLHSFDNCFHFVSTYNPHSAFPYAYNAYEKIEDLTSHRPKLKHKTKLVVWMVSNCHTTSRREAYVKLLTNHIAVDIYGKCGNFTCTKSRESTKDCMKYFARNYYFYLAFENTFCSHYITEKAWRALRYDIVPVVMGGGDYTASLPPGSYIDVNDFSSVKQLVNYLKRVAGDAEMYRSYLKWKSHYRIINAPSRFCQACRYAAEKGTDVEQLQLVPDVGKTLLDMNRCWTPPKWT